MDNITMSTTLNITQTTPLEEEKNKAVEECIVVLQNDNEEFKDLTSSLKELQEGWKSITEREAMIKQEILQLQESCDDQDGKADQTSGDLTLKEGQIQSDLGRASNLQQ